MIILSKLRERKRIFQAKLEESKNIEQEYRLKFQEKTVLEEQHQQLQPRLQQSRVLLAQAQQSYQAMEAQLQQHERQEMERKQLQTILHYEEQHILHLQQQMQHLVQQKQQLQQQLILVAYDPQRRNFLKQQIQEHEQKLQAHIKTIASAETRITHAQQMRAFLSTMEVCPTCKQKITADHISLIHQQEQHTLQEQEQLLQDIKMRSQLVNQEKQRCLLEDEALQQQESAYQLSQFQKKTLDEQEYQHLQLQQELEQLQPRLQQLREQLPPASVLSLEYLRQQCAQQRALSEDLRTQERSLAIEHASISTKLQDTLLVLQRLEEQRLHRNRLELKYTGLTRYQECLENFFLPLVETAEKKVMLKVHADFNAAFRQWFSILMDNDVIDVTIDAAFSPSITQNGYALAYEYLSGGEKTACALAYRLALNHVINELMSTIKTRDLVILDEPTDGFSDDQLGRLRIVLEELNAKQVIIVSHESKIESFVQHILKVEKKEHVSQVS